MFIHFILACSLLGIMPHSDCRRVEDRDKRSFDELDPISLDVDNDGKIDTITPRIYSVVVTRRPGSGARSKARKTDWITFDLKTSKGRVLESLFKYQYGADDLDYWVYALVPCDVNRDGGADLIFYAGDDTSDETVVLLNRGGRFMVHSRRVTGPED